MTLAGVKTALNLALRPLNIQINSLTAQRAEDRRLRALMEAGHFDQPVFPILESFRSLRDGPLLEDVHGFAGRFRDLATPERNETGFALGNGWFGSPDAEVAYAVVRRFRPQQIVEVGCGNSTKLLRQAIIDGALETRLLCIDPSPRTDVQKVADETWLQPVESLTPSEVVERLHPGDILFIDSSHSVRSGNDVVFLLLNVLPRLAAGTLVHIHDIFLPYEYPRNWIVDERWNWTEQYLVQALLASGDQYEVLWAGHYVQRLRPDLQQWLPPHPPGALASSLWLRKRR